MLGSLRARAADSSAAIVRAQLRPDLRVEAVSLGRALFEVYLGSNSVVPDARTAWAKGARALLATEQARPRPNPVDSAFVTHEP